MRFLWALVLCLLLSGCDTESQAVAATVTEPNLSSPVLTGYYTGNSPTEIRTKGAVREYPLDLTGVYGIKGLGNDLLVFSLDGTTFLTLLTGDTLIPVIQKQLPFHLAPEKLHIQNSQLTYYDPTTKELVILDQVLNTLSTIPMPEDLTGTPLLSSDHNTVYYCTATALRVWDRTSGFHRCIKEMAYDSQTATGLVCGETVIQCTIRDGTLERNLFLDTVTGSLLWQHSGEIQVVSEKDRYYALFPDGITDALVFGTDAPQRLIPRDLTGDLFLLSGKAVVSCFSSGNRIRLDLYDLSEGIRKSSLELDATMPVAISQAGDYIYVLTTETENMLYRWDPKQLTVADSANYIAPHFSKSQPDLEGLERCQTYANIIGQQHGIQVKVGPEAAANAPWDYDLEAEYLVPVLEDALQDLEQRLSYYPDSMLEATASHFSSLNICLVRSITGSAESGSLDTATGIQFFDGQDAYVVIAVGEFSRQALYHELFHAMQTHLMTRPTALDRWEDHNPTGFRYDYNYATNKARDSGIYLRSDSRSFIDTYSMSFPKEDKARVMEYAMAPGMATLFQSNTMQAKLRCLSQGLREAYNLEDSKEVFLWEQYLQ